MVGRSGLDPVVWVISAGIAVLAVIFFITTYRLALGGNDNVGSRLSRGLFGAGAFFLLSSIGFGYAALVFGDRQLSNGVLGPLVLAAICFGTGFAAKGKRGNGKDAT